MTSPPLVSAPPIHCPPSSQDDFSKMQIRSRSFLLNIRQQLPVKLGIKLQLLDVTSKPLGHLVNGWLSSLIPLSDRTQPSGSQAGWKYDTPLDSF